MEKSNQETKINKTVHSNVRKGLSDFNDGNELTHYLGNDDYKNGNNESDPYADNLSFDGSEAFGNDLTEEDIEQEGENEKVSETKKSERRSDSSGQDVF